ncbi:MAG TPA: iron-containing alcohol dehydrogenase [Candidatus Cryosericum sp.]|nr:iron-containing alcohol dehydrogenase [Candidatus Cryosericum sp.]
MLNFEYYSPTRLIFGKGVSKEIGEHIFPLARRVLIHYGSERIAESGLLACVEASLKEAGVSYIALGGVRPNPDIELAKRGVELAREFGAELVLCIGGGSVIDSGKAIAIGLKNPQYDLWSTFVKMTPLTEAAPVASILTFPAAGSESSNSCVMSNYLTRQKIGTNRECSRPVLAVIDPTLFTTIPKFQIACGVADMMSHIFERYFSNTEHTELIDVLAESTLKTLIAFGPVVYENPEDTDAWSQVALAGTIAHNNMLGVGREQDWACHKLSYQPTIRFGVTHGAGLAVLTPAWIRHVWRANPRRFVDFAVKIMGIEYQAQADAASVEAGVAALESFYSLLELPHRLSMYGVTPESIPEMAKETAYHSDGSPKPLGGIKKLTEADVIAIYEAAL